MSENQKTNVDANTLEFKRGGEAGINSEDTKYWQAGYGLAQGLSDRETKELVKEVSEPKSDTPLFLMATLDAKKNDPQDEQDKSAE